MWGSSERLPVVAEDEAAAAAASCWGRLGLAALWRRLRQLSAERRRRRRRGRSILGAGGLNYDPLSYAQNFDDGAGAAAAEEAETAFSARFAPARHAAAPRPAAPPLTS